MWWSAGAVGHDDGVAADADVEEHHGSVSRLAEDLLGRGRAQEAIEPRQCPDPTQQALPCGGVGATPFGGLFGGGRRYGGASRPAGLLLAQPQEFVGQGGCLPAQPIEVEVAGAQQPAEEHSPAVFEDFQGFFGPAGLEGVGGLPAAGRDRAVPQHNPRAGRRRCLARLEEAVRPARLHVIALSQLNDDGMVRE
ncbi:hypothetical protein [Streptomyces sp. NPDC016626]|uniref:hypothetical protein n=1 Tax=Streptomyces sp. NPDC016626 TaxID=3364968 RepID=UPI0036F8DCCC